MNTPNDPIQLAFPPVSPDVFEDAQRAIQQEYDDANSWKRLHCSFIEPVPESQTGSREISFSTSIMPLNSIGHGNCVSKSLIPAGGV